MNSSYFENVFLEISYYTLFEGGMAVKCTDVSHKNMQTSSISVCMRIILLVVCTYYDLVKTVCSFYWILKRLVSFTTLQQQTIFYSLFKVKPSGC